MADKKKRRKNLKWGHTPWETMPREQLEREMEKAYFALRNCSATLRQHRLGYESTPYWQEGGSGHQALALAEDVFAPYVEQYMEPEFYYEFYRTAYPLIFPSQAHRNWAYCPECKNMLSGLKKEETEKNIGKPCPFSNCNGVMEWYTWEQFRKDAA